MMKWGLKKQTVLTFIVLCPVFLVFSLLLSRWWEGRLQDFSTYWQAGHMILEGQNVYDSVQWEAARQAGNIVKYPARTFPYPLPLAILFSLPALLPLQSAYTLWMFLAQIAILVSIMILLGFYPARSGYFELLTITGIFFFRPMFSIVNSGQILPFLILPLAISIRLFHDGKWFAGGFFLAVLSLKPSVGFPLLVLVGIWLAFRRQWRGIWGMMAGGLVLVLIGALVNYRWILDYVDVSESSFYRFFGMQPALWGVIGKIFKAGTLSLIIGFLCMAVVFAVEAYLLWRQKSNMGSFAAFASMIPAALLVAPYAWNYDQVLLIIPIIFLLINISVKYGTGKAVLFMFGVVTLAFMLLAVAYWVKHDVWSYLNTLLVWIFSLYFVAKNDQMPNE